MWYSENERIEQSREMQKTEEEDNKKGDGRGMKC
jgi:hypothetical protein